MRSARLLVFLGLMTALLVFVPAATAPVALPPLPELAGRWKVETATVGGQIDPFRQFDELVFTEKTVEYLSTQPRVAETLSAS